VEGLAQSQVELVEALRAGDEAAFARIVDELSPGLMRLARVYVSTDAAAEEVVQETWIGVVNGLDRFEGRSTLKTWIFRILVNVAKTRGVRDARSVPFSSLDVTAGEDRALDPDRFFGDHARSPGQWSIAPAPWPEDAVWEADAMRLVRDTVDGLPRAQREVITLRDMVGCSAAETCSALDLSEANQRVLLHRARAKVRAALERAFDEMGPV
jgi:RNA polymerase sigma-70 factor, ECF subfamily